MLQQPQKNQQESINQSTTTCNKNLQTRIIIPQDTKQSQTSKVHKTIKKETKKFTKKKKTKKKTKKPLLQKRKGKKETTSSTGQAVGYSNRSKRGFVIEQNPP